jgi:hypothetical protein
MNWTTTKVPLWQADCENFRKAGPPFELRDVTAQEHLTFIKDFATRNRLKLKRAGSVVRFEIESS